MGLLPGFAAALVDFTNSWWNAPFTSPLRQMNPAG